MSLLSSSFFYCFCTEARLGLDMFLERLGFLICLPDKGFLNGEAFDPQAVVQLLPGKIALRQFDQVGQAPITIFIRVYFLSFHELNALFGV